MINKKYSFNPESRYLTRGINSEVPLSMQMLLWDIIDRVVASDIDTDYLSVFKFKEDNNNVIVIYSQEEPSYIQEHPFKMQENYRVLIGKTIFVIDDVTHSTMLLASEY